METEKSVVDHGVATDRNTEIDRDRQQYHYEPVCIYEGLLAGNSVHSVEDHRVAGDRVLGRQSLLTHSTQTSSKGHHHLELNSTQERTLNHTHPLWYHGL